MYVANCIRLILGNGRCDGGTYNSIECGFDGGDCLVFNSKYPNCTVPNPSWVGDGVCDGDIRKVGTEDTAINMIVMMRLFEYHTEACGFDGGDCAPPKYPNCINYNPYIDLMTNGISKMESGVCTKHLNSRQCDWDGEDCIEFNAKYPGCQAEEPSLVGDGVCTGGLAYTEECDWDGGDCDDFIKRYPNCPMTFLSLIGDGVCTNFLYNNDLCGYEDGDCIEFNEEYPDCKAFFPIYLGDGLCDGGLYNTSECGWDQGDCN